MSKPFNVGEKIYSLRTARGMSQDELAEALDVSRQTISNWENDKVTLDIEKAVDICKLFNIGLDEFVSGATTDGEQKQPLSKPKTKTIVLTVFAAVLFALAVLLFVFGFTAADGTSGGSFVAFTPRLGYILGGVVCVVFGGISTFIIYKNAR